MGKTIACPHCGKEINKEAYACPFCGRINRAEKSRSRGYGMISGAVITLAGVLLYFMNMFIGISLTAAGVIILLICMFCCKKNKDFP